MLDLVQLVGDLLDLADAVQSLAYAARGVARLAARVAGWLHG